MKQKQIGCHLLVAVDARNWIWSSYDILVTDSFRFLIEGIKKKKSLKTSLVNFCITGHLQVKSPAFRSHPLSPNLICVRFIQPTNFSELLKEEIKQLVMSSCSCTLFHLLLHLSATILLSCNFLHSCTFPPSPSFSCAVLTLDLCAHKISVNFFFL